MSRYCEKCGAELEEGSKFCDKCGAAIVAPNNGQLGGGLKPLKPLGTEPKLAPTVNTSQGIRPLSFNQNQNTDIPKKLPTNLAVAPHMERQVAANLEPTQQTEASVTAGLESLKLPNSGFTSPSAHSNDAFCGSFSAGAENFIKENFLNVEGRLNRKPFIYRSIILFAIITICAGIIENIGSGVFSYLLLVVATIAYIGSLYSYFRLSICRLHDLGHSGWMSLLHFTGLLVFYLVFCPGTVGDNRYGPDPQR